MRITGGSYRGRRIVCPPGIIRPSMDRMRESYFSILGDLEGSSFLDLYSGSGIIGIEAASRGATPVFLVEKDPRKKPVLIKNISFVKEEIRVVIMPVERFIRMQKIAYDYIFLDPPFKQKAKLEVIDAISGASLLSGSGVLSIHHPVEEIFPEYAGAFRRKDKRTYGGSVITFYGY